MNVHKIAGIVVSVLLVILIAVQVLYLSKDYKKQSEGLEDYTVTRWSSPTGYADGRLVLNRDNPQLTQYFTTYDGKTKQLTFFFYHCGEGTDGILYLNIIDGEGTVLKEASVEISYYGKDVLCYGYPVEELELAAGTEYGLEAVFEAQGDCYIEAGITTNPSKPAVYRNFEDGTALYLGMEYSYMETYKVRDDIRRKILLFAFIDLILLIWIPGIIWGKFAAPAVATAGICLICSCVVLVSKTQKDGVWYENEHFIIHALGTVDELEYMNCLEGLEASYAGGYHLFEADFARTSDGEYVLKHDWEIPFGLPDFENGYIPTREEFLAEKIYGKYTTMDLKMVLDKMLEYREIYLVTDSKDDGFRETCELFSKINEITSGYSAADQSHIKDHLIVQIYNEDMFTAAEMNYDAKHYLYTLYKRGSADNLDELLRFCDRNDIHVITMPYPWWSEEVNDNIHSHGMKTFLHPIEPEQYYEYLDKGVDGFYVDITDLNEFLSEAEEYRQQ